MSSFSIKKGDRLPLLTATLKQRVGTATETAIDLTGATVLFLMRNASTEAVKVNAAATVVSAAAGTVSYAWASADTDTVGQYEAEWEITYTASGKKLTVPNSGFDRVLVYEDIA